MLPYSLAFAISWVVLLALWLILGIPLGPGSGMVYPPA
jgi:aminobenzoyl-glutamate transport protein